jgi:type IV secretion system protein VirB5
MKMSCRPLRPLIAAAAFSLSPIAARAQGIPVIDIANLIQTIQQVMNDLTQIDNQVQQIGQLQRQADAITGTRGLGSAFDAAALHNYVPPNSYRFLAAVDAAGYAALTPTARALRDAQMLYNCLELAAPARVRCQAELARPYQQKGLLQDAMSAAAGRLAQIRTLMAQIDATDDQKAALEIQARIGAENAMLGHELTQIHMLQGMAETDERIARARERERQLEMLNRSGRIADHLP